MFILLALLRRSLQSWICKCSGAGTRGTGTPQSWLIKIPNADLFISFLLAVTNVIQPAPASTYTTLPSGVYWVTWWELLSASQVLLQHLFTHNEAKEKHFFKFWPWDIKDKDRRGIILHLFPWQPLAPSSCHLGNSAPGKEAPYPKRSTLIAGYIPQDECVCVCLLYVLCDYYWNWMCVCECGCVCCLKTIVVQCMATCLFSSSNLTVSWVDWW